MKPWLEQDSVGEQVVFPYTRKSNTRKDCLGKGTALQLDSRSLPRCMTGTCGLTLQRSTQGWIRHLGAWEGKLKGLRLEPTKYDILYSCSSPTQVSSSHQFLFCFIPSANFAYDHTRRCRKCFWQNPICLHNKSSKKKTPGNRRNISPNNNISILQTYNQHHSK